jgi:hypothetical protein
MVKTIRYTGWLGISINAFAISTQINSVLLIGQVVSAFTGFVWCLYLQNKLTPDIILSFLLTVIAALMQNTFVLFAAMLVRSVNYQLMFERVVKQRST